MQCFCLYEVGAHCSVFEIFTLVPVLGGGLFGQPVQNANPSNQLYNAASALNAPTLLGDERDAIMAKWNQLQALWGTGKGYFNNNIPPVEFTQENPFCRFKVTYRLFHHFLKYLFICPSFFKARDAPIPVFQYRLQVPMFFVGTL